MTFRMHPIRGVGEQYCALITMERAPGMLHVTARYTYMRWHPQHTHTIPSQYITPACIQIPTFAHCTAWFAGRATTVYGRKTIFWLPLSINLTPAIHVVWQALLHQWHQWQSVDDYSIRFWFPPVFLIVNGGMWVTDFAKRTYITMRIKWFKYIPCAKHTRMQSPVSFSSALLFGVKFTPPPPSPHESCILTIFMDYYSIHRRYKIVMQQEVWYTMRFYWGWMRYGMR